MRRPAAWWNKKGPTDEYLLLSYLLLSMSLTYPCCSVLTVSVAVPWCVFLNAEGTMR
jgi:hypothetical protein